MTKYAGWNLKELKVELKKRGAKLSGRKHELVERLESYDRNHNFGNYPAAASRTWKMVVPDATSYRDITNTSDISVTTEAVTAYLDKQEEKLDKKAKELYEERFLRYAKSTKDNNNTYITMQIRAEMKKTVTYDVDIKLDPAGCVSECQCDCLAGMGPQAHCKHIRTALYGTIQFTLNRYIHVELSCTDQIQKHHRPKRLHTGSPVKAENLKIMKDTSLVIFDPMEGVSDETDEEYISRVRNLSINYASSNNEQMPILQTYVPANPVAVDMDHSYIEGVPSENFLESQHISKISKQEIRQIEEETSGQRNNPTWLKERTKRIQSSMFGDVAKSTERRDKDKLASSLMIVKDLSHIKAIQHGIEYEEEAIQRYERETGKSVKRMGLIIDEERPYLGTSVDGLCGDIVVEAKCPYTSCNKKINHVTVPYLKKTSQGLQLDPKHNYYYQVQGQMHILNKDLCHLAVYTIDDFKIVEVHHDPDFCQVMLKKLDDFFMFHFKPMYLQKRFYHNYSQYDWS